MKRHNHIIIIICIVLFGLAFGLEFLREWEEEGRNSETSSTLHGLSISLENFKEEKGHYPQTLSELRSNDDFNDEQGKKAIRDLINFTRHNPYHDTYVYISSTNGFTIIVTGPESAPAGWFGKQRKIEKHYELGKVLDNVIVTTNVIKSKP
jgi:hypothetical protein